jgi:hypothetical protein
MTDAHNSIGSQDSCRRNEYMKSRARRFDMKALCNLFVLMLASFALASCGGGGGGSNSAFGGTPAFEISITASPASVTTNSFTTLTVTVKNPGGANAPDGTAVTASLSPATIGSLSGASASGATATNTVTGGVTTFLFNSSNQTGTAHITATASSSSKSIDVAVNAGSTQDPRLALSPTAVSLPLNPYAASAQVYPFPSNYLGSPWISEVTVTWRHSNGQLVAGTEKVNVSIDPVTLASFSTLDDPATQWTGQTKTPPTYEGNEFLTLLGSGPVNVTGGNGVIFVHANDIPGTTVLSVVAIDPDTGQTITSQLPITIAGASSNLPTSVTASSDGAAYVSGSGGPQSVLVRAAVTDGNNALVPDPSGFDNVEFTITGPSGTDVRLSGLNAAGGSVVGNTVDTVTHNGIATVSVLSGSKQGPVQIKASIDRGDGNVDNGIQDAVSSTATVVISDGKLFKLTLQLPEGDAIAGGATSSAATEDPPGSGNYVLAIGAKGVDRQGNAVLPGTVIGFGAIDSPQSPTVSTSLQNWFQISGSKGDPQEGGNLFTATDGHFTTAGGGAGPGDTLLVIGKASQGAPAGNDDLESSSKVTSINSATSLNVGTIFNRNDGTGTIANYGSVLPYIIGRGEFGSVVSPAYTDASSSTTLTGVATTTLSYPANAIGKAVALWAQGTGTDIISGTTDVVADVATFVYPGLATGAVMTASPDPLAGNTTTNVTVCYYDGNNHPIPNFDISFAFNFGGVGSGTADGVSTSGKLAHLTGADGCVTIPVTTASLPTSTGSGGPSITFSAGPLNTESTGGGSPVSVTVPFVVNAAQLQVSCPQTTSSAAPFAYNVTLTLLDSSGAGIPGETITASCTPGTLAAGTIAATNSTGSTSTVVTDSTGDGGTCTFQSSSFSSLVATLSINAAGTSSCNGGFSPQPH